MTTFTDFWKTDTFAQMLDARAESYPDTKGERDRLKRWLEEAWLIAWVSGYEHCKIEH